ncbi:ABC transporter ATP-binding protein [Candidatus Hecatella orcuttiae]|uniref:ABC transporter ATP-binding protein n=1 Tax=Candidatus Hecatella orcuttiae TaxID=1935119 RepID=UPI0039C88498
MLLRVEDLYVDRGSINVLHGVSIKVEKGSITCVIGPNGAGKTTLLLSIVGILPPRKGRNIFKGKDITFLPSYKRVEMGMSLVPEGRGLFQGKTVEENLLSGAFRKEARLKCRDNLDRVYSLFPILKERRKQLASSLSGGEQQMLAVARALMSNLDFLMLDEPSLGLAPIIVSKLYDTVKSIREEGVTVLVVEQNVHQILRVADFGYVLENGRIVHADPCDKLIEAPEIKSAYLGL